MITHEQMRQRINNINKFDLVDTEVMTLDYIAQQEKKDKLLELYRKTFTKNISNTNYEEWIILESQIKALEEELK